jgi:hypothetical protein
MPIKFKALLGAALAALVLVAAGCERTAGCFWECSDSSGYSYGCTEITCTGLRAKCLIEFEDKCQDLATEGCYGDYPWEYDYVEDCDDCHDCEPYWWEG